jgi:hypothetical protein
LRTTQLAETVLGGVGVGRSRCGLPLLPCLALLLLLAVPGCTCVLPGMINRRSQQLQGGSTGCMCVCVCLWEGWVPCGVEQHGLIGQLRSALAVARVTCCCCHACGAPPTCLMWCCPGSRCHRINQEQPVLHQTLHSQGRLGRWTAPLGVYTAALARGVPLVGSQPPHTGPSAEEDGSAGSSGCAAFMQAAPWLM